MSQSYVANASYDSAVIVNDSNCGGGGFDDDDSECEQLRPGEDYRWDNQNGTVKALENGSINESEESTISYRYGVPTDQQQRLIGVFASGYQAMAPLVVILMVGVALGALLRFVS